MPALGVEARQRWRELRGRCGIADQPLCILCCDVVSHLCALDKVGCVIEVGHARLCFRFWGLVSDGREDDTLPLRGQAAGCA